MTARPDSPAVALRASAAPAAQQAAHRLAAELDVVPIGAADVIVVVGGDGTLLDTLHELLALPADRPPPPVFGLHRGTIGFFMNEWADDDGVSGAALCARIAAAEHDLIHPLRITGTALDGSALNPGYACNEVAVRRIGAPAARLRICIDGEARVADLRGDGVLVATPAGSTGYNRSAHGPVVPLGSGLIAVTPICAMRPRRWPGALVDDRSTVEIDALTPELRPVVVSTDQRSQQPVRAVSVHSEPDRTLTLLFDPRSGLSQRIVREQFSP